MMQRVTGILVALALLSWAGLATAASITEFTTFSGFGISQGTWGQEVATGSGGPWRDITFSFLNESTSPETSSAAGTIFLLSEEYSDKPSNLSSSTSGYVATGTANAAGTAWDFDSGVTLQPNTNYWFYSSTSLPPGSLTAPGQNQQGYSEPSWIVFKGIYQETDYSIDFRLSGDPTGSSTPEPSSFVLFGMAVTGSVSPAGESGSKLPEPMRPNDDAALPSESFLCASLRGAPSLPARPVRSPRPRSRRA